MKNDSKTCIRKLILETLDDENMSMSQTSSSSCEGYDLQISPCSAVNVVQYVLQNVNSKRGASLMYIHFYLHEGTCPVDEDCLARRLYTYIWGKRCFYWIYYKKFEFDYFPLSNSYYKQYFITLRHNCAIAT